ncbi:unnamed protein product [Camellia sinensis]
MRPVYLFLLPMHNEKIIIVGSLYKRWLYAYYVCQDSWDVVDEKFELISPYCDPVLASHTLYWVGDEIIHAYDLNEKIFLRLYPFLGIERSFVGFKR